MALREPEPPHSIVGAQMSLDASASITPAPPAKPTGREHRQATAVGDSDATIQGLNLRLMRSGAALLVGLEVIYFLADFYLPPSMTLATAALHAGTIGVTAIVLALTMTEWFERNWRSVCFANLLAIYGLTLALRALAGDTEPLFITLVLTLIGAGALLEWSTRWQVGLSATALFTTASPALVNASVGPEAFYRWVGVSIAAALGQFILLVRERRRVEVFRWMNRLRTSHQELSGALARSATIMAERELAEERLHAEIAERETAQRRLQQSEETLRRIFETSLDAIAVNRWPDLTFIDLNERHTQVFGIPKEQALAAPPRTFRLWAQPDQFRCYLREMAARGFVQNMEADFVTRDGSARPFLCSSALVELNGQQCAVSTLRDITHLKQTERELIAAREAALAASEAKSHFLSVMSHEIRTPMNAILGMADLLWETALNSEQRRYLDTMRNNSASLLNLINGILDLSRVESGRLSLEQVAFDLVELAEDVMQTLAVRAHEKGLELALRIPCTFPTALTGDPLRLRQILINLLGNAIKFTEHGEVTLTIEAADPAQAGEPPDAPSRAEGSAGLADAGSPTECQTLRFAVRDTGIGIPAERQQAIFSNFIQADSTVSRNYGGSGLGLAIVKRLVELMNGKVTVESRPREGSVFSFTVALGLQPGARAPSLDGMTRLTGKRVLVVDDSPASRVILAELLATAGAEVTVAADGTGALDELVRARADGQPYDAVVAESRVLESDGAAIAQQVVTPSPTPREALVLMLPANDLNARIGRLRERGLQESQRCRYLLKPVRRADLWATLGAACAGSAGNGAHAAGHDAFIQRAAPPGAALLVKRPLRILLAEDSPDNRLLVEAYLKETPYLLDHAENGEVAVRKFMSVHYDAILMDIQMPVMDGYEAVAEIRRLERGGHRRPTPIIALTASAHDGAVRRSLKMGCDAHVTKPVKRSTLLETIRDAVEPAAQSAPSGAQAAASGTAGAAAMGSGKSIVIHVDQDLSDLIPGFLTRKRDDARAILAAVEHGDHKAIARLGHKMKGEGGSYGLDAITDLGCELEQAGTDNDLDAARRLGGDLMNFLERLEIVYRSMDD
jgi:PAS domain S-box-containing protein